MNIYLWSEHVDSEHVRYEQIDFEHEWCVHVDYEHECCQHCAELKKSNKSLFLTF